MQQGRADVDPPAQIGEAGKWFAGALALAVSVGTFLGITGGNVERILRNHPWELIASIVCLASAAVIGALIPVFAVKMTKARTIESLLAAAALVVVGVLALAYAARQSASDQQRPRIDAQLTGSDSKLVLKGT